MTTTRTMTPRRAISLSLSLPLPAREERALVVRDLMTDVVFTLVPHDNLESAAELMEIKHIRHLPVVDREGDLIGLVTQRDLARSMLGAIDDLPISVRTEVLSRRRVREIMVTEIDTAEPDTDLREAAEMLLENKIGCLPIVEGSRLVGILTEADFVRHYVDRLERARPISRGRG